MSSPSFPTPHTRPRPSAAAATVGSLPRDPRQRGQAPASAAHAWGARAPTLRCWPLPSARSDAVQGISRPRFRRASRASGV